MVVNKQPCRVGDEVEVATSDAELFIRNGKAIKVIQIASEPTSKPKRRRKTVSKED